LAEATELGDAWMEKNYTVTPGGSSYYYYFLYAYERYQAFKEIVDKTNEPEPKWYTDFAKEVIRRQSAEGSWEDRCGPIPDTAFAVLFLIRSTRIRVQDKLGSGMLVGGRGLPGADEIRLDRTGNIVAKPLVGPADQLLTILENASSDQFENALAGLSKLETDEALLSEHVVRLKRLAKSDAPAARAAAIKTLSRTRNLDNAPLLIFALEDEDWDVVREARDGLRFLSRKFERLGPPVPCQEFERREAIEKWKAWYASVRPDYKFTE
jgi:hypothetical protein